MLTVSLCLHRYHPSGHITGFILTDLRVMQSLSPREECTASGQRRLKPERPPRLKPGQDVP